MCDRRKLLGFTLIETIAALLLTSIVGSMIYSYSSITIDRNQSMLAGLQQSFDLRSVMEKITADYSDIIQKDVVKTWRPSQWYNQDDIVASKSLRFGHQYRCVTSGFSGASEPAWQTGEGDSITDNSVVWRESGAQLLPLLERLITLENGTKLDAADGVIREYSHYGRYGIEYKSYIKFVRPVDLAEESEIMDDEPENLVRITLKNDMGERLTALLSTSY